MFQIGHINNLSVLQVMGVCKLYLESLEPPKIIQNILAEVIRFV